MQCAQSLSLLSEYRDGGLDPTLRAEVHLHISGCEPCRAVLADLVVTVTAAGELRGPAVHPAPDENAVWLRMRIVQGGG
jgi:anti-sigma factor RsiW